jgi:hypothetical protein
MRTIAMEDDKGSYIHGDEFRGIHVNKGNVEIESNGRRERQDIVTMIRLQR